jgi:hypothetical protein
MRSCDRCLRLERTGVSALVCTPLQVQSLLLQFQPLLQNGVILSLAWTHPDDEAARELLGRGRLQGRKRGRAHDAAADAATQPPASGSGAPAAALEAALGTEAPRLRTHPIATQRCTLFVKVHRHPILVGGRYLKLHRGVSQSPWLTRGSSAPAEASVQVCRAHACVLPLERRRQWKAL